MWLEPIKRIGIALLGAFFLTTVQARDRIVSLEDASGDDNGDGKLIYPQRADYQPGDMDLRRLSIERDSDGFWFEIEFANPIRNPAETTTGPSMGNQSMATTARRGFYSFQVDIYVDTDRISGSGNQFTLPGRKVRIDPDFAWERAVILTPRPEMMRSALIDTLEEEYPDRPTSDAEAMIDQTIFFPTDIKVRGRRIAFRVPREFFGGTDGSDWALTAFVTGAKPYESLGVKLLTPTKSALERFDMGVMQPTPGGPADTFGYPSNRLPSPVVDLLAPSAEHQTALLAGGWPLTGVSWGPHAKTVAVKPPNPESLRAERNVPEDNESFLTDPLGVVKRLFTDEREPTRTKRPAIVKPDTAKRYLDPTTKGNATDSERTAPPRADVATRMQTLKRLLDDGLISKEDYERQKARLLSDL